jgi:hypothetical protein
MEEIIKYFFFIFFLWYFNSFYIFLELLYFSVQMSSTSSSSSPSLFDKNPQIVSSLRVVLPVIYSVLAIIGLIGNLIVLQIICAHRFRHKSIHLLVSSLLVADICFIIIYSILHIVSYSTIDIKWFINPSQWCKAELYLLHLFDFILAYTILFIAVDRSVSGKSCWFSVRKLRAGVSIVISIWIASAYVIIPILFFDQIMKPQSYGGYICMNTNESVALFWLSSFPNRTLDFIDIVFRIFFPLFLMLILIVVAACRTSFYQSNSNGFTSNIKNLKKDKNKTIS